MGTNKRHKWNKGPPATDADGYFIRVDTCKVCGCIVWVGRRAYGGHLKEYRTKFILYGADFGPSRPKCNPATPPDQNTVNLKPV